MKIPFYGRRTGNSKCEHGYVLVMVLGIGMVMSLMGMGLILRSQQDVAIASGRKETGQVSAISEGGIARTLALLKQPQNAALLTRNYDPINPRTGKNYLGIDGALNSGDETNTAIDEWTGYNPSTSSCYQQVGRGAPNMPITGSIGGDGTYTLKAYRYDLVKKVGHVLIEGRSGNKTSAVLVTFTLNPVLDTFPGILSIQYSMDWGTVGLRNRVVLGKKGNIYFPPNISADPSLSSFSRPGDANRSTYLNALYASPTQDGATADNIQGTLFACKMQPTSSLDKAPASAIALGSIISSQTLTGVAGQTTHYLTPDINLLNNDTLTIDTTAGPVVLWSSSTINLRNTAKILNIRTDGKSPQVGDFRLRTNGSNIGLNLYGQTCIQNAFIYHAEFKVELLTSGVGCPSGRNTNIEGVIWAGVVSVAKNVSTNRHISSTPLVYSNTTITNTATSGIYVPDDLTSLIDMLPTLNWPVRYQFGEITTWRRQRL